MDAGPPKSTACSLKNVTKFCLVYYTTLLVLIIIFTALNTETMDSSQTRWWWAFLCSLFVTGAMSLTALVIMIYTDNCKAIYVDPDNDPSTTFKSRLPVTTANQSFKTVLTISSRDPNLPKSPIAQSTTPTQPLAALQQPNIPEKPISVEPPGTSELGANSFVNLTAQSGTTIIPNVTVVDMPAINAKKNILRNNYGTSYNDNNNINYNPNDYKMPSNLVLVSDANNTKKNEIPKRERKRRPQRGARKKKVKD